MDDGLDWVRPVMALVDLVRTTSVVLLDFDGPTCGVFSDHPNYAVANRLRAFPDERGVALPPALATGPDPLLILRWVREAEPALVAEVDQILSSEETTAVKVARPTDHAHDLLRLLQSRGMPTAIVSNNSVGAIAAYLAEHELTDAVRLIAGRWHGQPDRMKPEPDLLVYAAQELGTPAADCLFVGDSTSDMEAATAAGVHSVGFAKSNRHRAELEATGAELVIDDLLVLVRAVERT